MIGFLVGFLMAAIGGAGAFLILRSPDDGDPERGPVAGHCAGIAAVGLAIMWAMWAA
jgi:hypothetical protein